jgi:hypothetical protein
MVIGEDLLGISGKPLFCKKWFSGTFPQKLLYDCNRLALGLLHRPWICRQSLFPDFRREFNLA